MKVLVGLLCIIYLHQVTLIWGYFEIENSSHHPSTVDDLHAQMKVENDANAAAANNDEDLSEGEQEDGVFLLSSVQNTGRVNDNDVLPTTAASHSPFQGAKIRTFDEQKRDTNLFDGQGMVNAESFPIVPYFEKKCSKWGVLTTIFDPTLAIKRVADLPSWCVVVVADTKTPADYMQKLGDLHDIHIQNATNHTTQNDDDDGNIDVNGRNSSNIDNVYFFSVDKQKEWENVDGPIGAFARQMPWNHFCRKNLGYLFAILHGADYIFDFDDDNYIKLDTSSSPPSPMNILPKEFGQGGIELNNVTVVIQGPTVFNHHPLMKPSTNKNESTWARGLPLENILDKITQGKAAFQKDMPPGFKTPNDEIVVLQYMVDGNPDIDAIHRLSKDLPITFYSGNDANPVLVPMHSYAPYNAQATVHMKKALWATLLPATVPGRVSDIWRSYFAQCIFMDAGLRLAFAPPKVYQERNEHDLLGDFIAEDDLYKKSGKLIEFLSTWDSDHDSIPQRMIQLWIDLYERGYIEIEDVTAVQTWLAALTQIGYEFPPLKRRFRNVAVMGQFNYADSVNLYDEIVFWAQKHREYFDTVIAAGPFSDDQIQTLEQYSIKAIASTPPVGRRVDGLYAPVENLMNALLLYRNSSKVEGILYAHDDTVLNVTELSQGQYPFPSRAIIGNTKKIDSHRMSYTDVRNAKDKQQANEVSYRIYPNGTFSDLNKTVFGDINTLWDKVPNFVGGWDMVKKSYCAGSAVSGIGNMAMAKDIDSAKYREEDGSIIFPSYTQADFLFVPTKYSDEFAEAARLHLKHEVWLECALPQIVDMIRQQTNALPVHVVKLCTTFHPVRGKEFMASRKCRNKGSIGVVHPLKLGKVGYDAFERVMDSFQFGLR